MSMHEITSHIPCLCRLRIRRRKRTESIHEQVLRSVGAHFSPMLAGRTPESHSAGRWFDILRSFSECRLNGSSVGPHLKPSDGVPALLEQGVQVIGRAEKPPAYFTNKRGKTLHAAPTVYVLSPMWRRKTVESQAQLIEPILNPNRLNIFPSDENSPVRSVRKTGVKETSIVNVSNQPHSIPVLALCPTDPALAKYVCIGTPSRQPSKNAHNVTRVGATHRYGSG